MDYLAFLRGAGFRRAERSGHRIIEQGKCVYIYSWDISEYSLWYTAFIADCLFIKIGYFVLCEQAAVAGYEALIEAQPELAPHYAPMLAMLRANKITTHADEVTIDTCAFSDPGDVKRADLENLFNSHLGVTLPKPPAAPTPN